MKAFKNIFVIVVIILAGCSKEDNNPSDIDKEYEVEVIDYKINNLEPNQIYPIRNYTNLNTDEEFIIYGKYNESFNFEKVTQIVYQNNQSHLEFSFDRNDVLTAITNYDLYTNEILDQLFIKEHNSKFYFSRNNETVNLQQGENVIFEHFSNDLIGNKLHQTLNKNREILSYLNGSDVIPGKTTIAKAVVIPPVVVGVIVVAVVIKAIKTFGTKKITKNTELESDNVSDLFDKICEKASTKNSSKSSVASNSNYSCASSEEIKDWRKKNHDLNLSICDSNRVCFLDCADIENGTAYYDSCNECVGGSTGMFDCSPKYPIQIRFNSITSTGVYTGDGDKECAGGPWIIYYLSFDFLDKENRILDDLSNLESTRTWDDFGCYSSWKPEKSESYFSNYPITISDSNIQIPYGISLADDISPSDWVEIKLYFRDITANYKPKISNEVIFRVERNVNYP